MFTEAIQLLDAASTVVIIQPENPDGDSLASALALEDMLGNRGKHITLFCSIDMPKYLRYIPGHDRVQHDWTGNYDLAIIVDTAAEALLQKTLSIPGIRHFLDSNPTVVFDHHSDADEDNDLSFRHTYVVDQSAAATGQLLHALAVTARWDISPLAAELMFISIGADTLGLSTSSADVATYQTAAELVRLGAVPSDIEDRRRQFMKKPADILTYKGKLLGRIHYHCDGRLATVHIPWEDIQQYSDRYNPSVLVLDEMRLVEGVDIAVAIKTYPDGKLTGKIRANKPIADVVAGYFGGGGHAYASGFKIFSDHDSTIHELVQAVDKVGHGDETA